MASTDKPLAWARSKKVSPAWMVQLPQPAHTGEVGGAQELALECLRASSASASVQVDCTPSLHRRRSCQAVLTSIHSPCAVAMGARHARAATATRRTQAARILMRVGLLAEESFRDKLD
jgi:hypothetical protein